MIRKGTTRTVLLIGNYVIKFPRTNKWKSFLRGILANLAERMWYKHSPPEWKVKMIPSIFTLYGFFLISKRGIELTENEYNSIQFNLFKPLPLDTKIQNFGKYKDKIVLIDYADSRYFCSDCECILTDVFNCKSN